MWRLVVTDRATGPIWPTITSQAAVVGQGHQGGARHRAAGPAVWPRRSRVASVTVVAVIVLDHVGDRPCRGRRRPGCPGAPRRSWRDEWVMAREQRSHRPGPSPAPGLVRRATRVRCRLVDCRTIGELGPGTGCERSRWDTVERTEHRAADEPAVRRAPGADAGREPGAAGAPLGPGAGSRGQEGDQLSPAPHGAPRRAVPRRSDPVGGGRPSTELDDRRRVGCGSSTRWTARVSSRRAGRTGPSTWPWPSTASPGSGRWPFRPWGVVLGNRRSAPAGRPRPRCPAWSSAGPGRPSSSRSWPSGWEPRTVPMGSAGAKIAAVIRGEAEVYVHAGGQYEWDSAAPVAVALASGLHASRLDGSPLRYSQPDPWLPDLVVCHPSLHRRGDGRPWHAGPGGAG